MNNFFWTLGILLALSGCCSYKPLSNLDTNQVQKETWLQVKPGKIYKFYMKNGRAVKMEITEIGGDNISGTSIESRQFRSVALADIIKVSRQKFNLPLTF